MTIQLELSAAGYQRLRDLADRAGVSVECFAQDLLESVAGDLKHATIPDEVFQRVKEATFCLNEELYRRLAKHDTTTP